MNRTKRTGIDTALKRRFGRDYKAKIVFTVLIGAIALTMTVPILWMLSASMKKALDVTKLPIDWIPDYFYPDNYVEVWNIGGKARRNYHFALAYFNSLKVTLTCVAGAVLTSTMTGYAFAKIKFRGRNVLFLLYLATMMIPSQITIIPKFVIFDALKLVGSHKTLILPGIFSITGTFLMRQCFMQIPDEIRESARVDGASEFRTWLQVMVPMAKSSMASLAIIIFLWTWNDYLNPLVFLPNWRLQTIPLALNSFVSEAGTEYHLMMAAASSALIPMFVMFIIGQKQLIKGITAGAVKG